MLSGLSVLLLHSLFAFRCLKGNNGRHLIKALYLQKLKFGPTAPSLSSNTTKTSVKRQVVQFAMDCSGSTPEKNQSNTAHGQRAAQDSTGGGGQSMTPVSTSSKLVTTRAIAPYNGHQHSEGAHSATENDKIEMIPLLPVSTASQSLSGK
jgi:hypothetical protein